MSSRNIRKLFGTNNVPQAEGDSEEEFEPLYAKRNGNPSTSYEGLELSSSSEGDDKTPDADDKTPDADDKTPDADDDLLDSAQAVEKSKKKKKRKQRKPKKQPMGAGKEELDEIDRSVMEVNALMGGPPLPVASPVSKPPNLAKELFAVHSKNLNYVNEVKKMFGSETPDEDGKTKKCRPHNVFKYRRACIYPTPENFHFQKIGLKMNLVRKDNGLSYFTYDHNRDYQKMHQNFLDLTNPEDVVPIDESRMNVHIEGLLESADFMFRTEEYAAATSIIEQIISYLQYAAHPSFNITDQTIRLEYRYMENRPFFVAVLKYLYMLSNRACHRTALELAKLLLGLDPSDPLAVIFVIDVLALRAREHQWLVDAVDYWDKSRDAKYLFNIKYSYALAHFHVTKKNKSKDMTRADNLLKEAMFAFPAVTAQILKAANHDASSSIHTHPLFSNPDLAKSPEKLRVAVTLYAKLVCWKFRENTVMEWLVRNATEALEMFDSDPDVKKRVETLAIQRHYLYGQCPVEVHRHLLIVRPMANLLAEWDMPRMMRSRAWDPLPPPSGINRYNYGPADIDPNYYTVLFSLFSSVMQNFVPPESVS